MRLITLFSFLQNIRDEIEIKTEENNSLNIIKEINFLKPEFFALPEFCIYYFENQIDHTERETKIMSIYNLKLERKNRFLKSIISIGDFIFIYYFYEIINIVLFICENVLLAIKYRKSRNEPEEKYNEIDNNKNFRSIEIFAIIHIIFNSIIIIHWLIFRAKIDLFYSITKYTNENLKEEDKLKIRDKAKLLKKEDFSVLGFFTIKIRRESQKNYYNNLFKVFKGVFDFMKFLMNVFLVFTFNSLRSIFPFMLSLICLCASFKSQIFFMFPLLLVFNLFESLRFIFFSSIIEGESSTFFLLILYIFLTFFLKCLNMKLLMKIMN